MSIPYFQGMVYRAFPEFLSIQSANVRAFEFYENYCIPNIHDLQLDSWKHLILERIGSLKSELLVRMLVGKECNSACVSWK